MKRRILRSAACAAVVAGCLAVVLRAPQTSGVWSKQTALLWLIDSWHGQTEGARPQLLLIDDDGGDGMTLLKRICDATGTKATFAIIPSRLSAEARDSLLRWQQEGFGICLHGYNHDDWEGWSAEAIVRDLDRSEQLLHRMGFERLSPYVVTPHGRNTRAARAAIASKGYKMVCGASVVNPDTTVFLLGRVLVTKTTAVEAMETLLRKARRRKAFVILGTHSSNPAEFSSENTKKVLEAAKRMNFEIL